MNKLASLFVSLAIFFTKSSSSLAQFPLNNGLLGRPNNELHLSPRQVAEHSKANTSHYPSTCDLCQDASRVLFEEKKDTERKEGTESGKKPVHGVSLKNNLQPQLLT